MCFGSAPKPDPSIGQAQLAMANLSAEQWASFKKDIWPQMLEQQKQYNQLAGRFIDSSVADSELARSQSQEYFSRLQNKFWPLEDQMIAEARQAGGLDDQQRAARAAQADVQTALGTQRAAALRAAGRYGGTSSGAAAAALTKTVVPGAAVQAAAQNNAREAAKQLGWAKRADVSSLSRGLPGSSAALLGMATQQGAAGLNAAQGGLAGLSEMSQALNRSAGTSIGGYNASGNLGLGLFDANMRRYQNKQNFWGDIIGGGLGAFGSWAGSAGGSAALASLFSDRRLKEGIKRVGKTTGGLPIYSYQYKTGGPKMLGVMADEVEKKIPSAVQVHPSGYKMVDYAQVK